ncbi:hypothetical protein OG496_24650 [Streptomyces sp. NBC_00988]|uniref:hypothetical protein n=1 Tax=Streptomyces sp. NBC_00988 TaxID=2903704 RepID=UPI00386C35C3|nr:hypothetical protein OG496_24650 [Streptomyces sp. NBC_00988]
MADELAFMAAQVLVRTVGTEAWAQLRPRLAEWFGKRGRKTDADNLTDLADLTEDTKQYADGATAEAHWRDRLRDVLVDAPQSATDELRAIVEESAGPPSGSSDRFDFRYSAFHGPVIGVQHASAAAGGGIPDPESWLQRRNADAIALGVHRTRRFPGESQLPPYARRDSERPLADFTVVTGEPLSGKSRTAWELVCAQTPPSARVYAPAPGTDLRGLPALLHGRDGTYVLWLDELEGHLGTPGGLDQGLLAQLAALRVLVVATMNDETYDARRFGGGPVSRALGQAVVIELTCVWSEAEFTRIAEGPDDPRLDDALKWRGELGVTQFLAVGPELWDEWRRARRAGAHPLGHWLVRVAVDVVRCGGAEGLPNDVLDYLAEEFGPADSGETLDDALEWASDRRFGVTGFLTPDEGEGIWQAAGTLVADTTRSPHAEPISLPAWAVAIGSAPSKDVGSALATAARADLRERGEAGDSIVMEALWDLANQADDQEEACLWAKRLAQADPAGSIFYCTYLGLHGFLPEAVRYLEMAAQDGSHAAALALASLLRNRADHWDRVASPEQTDTVKE